VKKEIEQHDDDTAARSDTQFANDTRQSLQAPDDDYSVPYELKNFSGLEGNF